MDYLVKSVVKAPFLLNEFPKSDADLVRSDIFLIVQIKSASAVVAKSL
jgi:hypothetical protein